MDERGRGEEVAVILRALHGEFHQEIFVDAPEDLASGGAERLAVEDAEDVFEDVVLEFVVILRELAEQRHEAVLDGVHRLHERCAEMGAFRELEDMIVACRLRQHERATYEEVRLDELPLRHFPRGLIRLDLTHRAVVAVRRVTQEDDAGHRHAVFARSQLRVRT